MRLSGSLAVLELVFFFFMPVMRAQNDLRRPSSAFVFGLGAGAFRFMPCFFAEARPLAFKPPLGSLPSLETWPCAFLAVKHCHSADVSHRRNEHVGRASDAGARNVHRVGV